VARILGLAVDTLIAYEPFSIQPWAYAFDGFAKFWFTFAPGLAVVPIRPVVRLSILLRFSLWSVRRFLLSSRSAALS
jgi:hypothetical protein